MPDGTRVADVSEVPESGSYLFTTEDAFTNEREVILIHCDEAPGVRAWVNTCTHESQKFDRGSGAPIRDGEIICPKHGSLFDVCTGECDNGEAAGTTLPSVEIGVFDDDVYLTDENYTYLREGGTGDDGPTSTSHLSF